MKKILYIGNKLEEHGFTPTSADSLPEKLKNEEIDFRVFSDKKNPYLRFMEMLYVIFKYRNWCDLILIDTYSTKNFWYAVCCGWLANSLNLRYIFIFHGGNLPERFANSSHRTLKIFRHAYCNVAPSIYMKNKLKNFQFKNVQFIPNSIDIEDYPFELRLEAHPKLFWLRAFDDSYNPKMALRVFQKLLKIYPKVEMIMVGPEKDGSLKQIEKLVKDKNLAVKLTGKLLKDDWISLSNSSDIFINTSRIDNLPISILEAMALGLPVISTNVGGIPALIEDGENGLLVKSDDAEAMAEKVKQVISNNDLYRKLSKNGRKTVEENFDWKQVKKLWVALLS